VPASPFLMAVRAQEANQTLRPEWGLSGAKDSLTMAPSFARLASRSSVPISATSSFVRRRICLYDSGSRLAPWGLPETPGGKSRPPVFLPFAIGSPSRSLAIAAQLIPEVQGNTTHESRAGVVAWSGTLTNNSERGCVVLGVPKDFRRP
jgi:hypothetical protein